MASTIPNEIIEKILLSLGKYDLFSSRLVSRDWNSMSLEVLQKSKYRQKFASVREVTKYVEFAVQSPQFVLPFDITASLTIFDTNLTELQTLCAQVERLVEMFGNECVSDFNVRITSENIDQTRIHALISLFGQISKGLQNLNIDTSTYSLNATAIQDAWGTNHNFDFPKMKKFHLALLADAPTINLQFCLPLVEKCPNLKIFELQNHQELQIVNGQQVQNNVRIPISQLESLKLHNFPKHLILEQLAQPGIILRNLELSVSLTGGNIVEIEVQQILHSTISESLESLGLSFRRPNFDTSISMLPFPIFRKLKSLGIWFKDSSYFPRPIEFALNSASFPALESIDISYNVLAIIKNKFPRVNSLALRVGESDMDSDWNFGHFTNEFKLLKPYRDHMEKLHQMFPELTKICVQNTCSIDKGEWAMKYVLNGILRSSGAGKIKEIILKDCAHNFLGDILHLVHNPPRLVLDTNLGDHLEVSKIRKSFQRLTGSTESQMLEIEEGSEGQRSTTIQAIDPEPVKLKNVQRFVLRVRASQSTTDELFGRVNQMKKLHVDVMVKHLVHLKRLDISAYYFGTDSGIRMQLIQEILAKFPDLLINLI